MRNRTYGGVRGRKTKVGRKLLRFPPTRLCSKFRSGSSLPLRTRYWKRPPTVRNCHSVRKTGSYGTRRVFRSIRCKKQASTARKGYSVPKTAFSGTRRIKGPQNSRLHILWTASCRTRCIFRGVPCQKQHLPHRTHLQCAERPPRGGEQT